VAAAVIVANFLANFTSGAPPQLATALGIPAMRRITAGKFRANVFATLDQAPLSAEHDHPYPPSSIRMNQPEA
jgi:hypothetical protein